MEMQRTLNIILSELSLKNLKLQDDLEREINSKALINYKVSQVESILRELSINELMIAKFQSLIQKPNNNQTQNQNENG